MTAPKPVVMMAGGTGGHVFPALAVAEQLRAQGIPVEWIGTAHGLEATLVPKAGIRLHTIGVAGLRGKGIGRLISMPFILTRAMVQAGHILRTLQPRVALGMGGFASGPGGIMAKMLGIPLVIHEQNAIAGLTNRCLSRIADRTLQAFPSTFRSTHAATTVGNPVRAMFAALPTPEERFAQREGPIRLLVLGGSQGALALNQRVPQALALLPESTRPEVWHQAGGHLHEAAQTAYRDLGVAARVAPFIDDMAEAYGWADVVICRSGALTVAELAAAGVGALLIPFPYAVDDHQTANARYLTDGGAAWMVQQSALTAEQLAALWREQLADRALLLQKAIAARALAKIDAAEHVTAMCLAQAR